MNHNEHSTGGSEFFPIGQEFSSAQQEFTRISPEVIPITAEANQSGSEFDQSTGPDRKAEKKRRRNISPAMLTTAAVVTAAVIVSPLSSSVTSSQSGTSAYPDLTLSAQSKVILDEIWSALPEGDPEQLISLVLDERLRTFVAEDAAPYVEMLEQDYGLEEHYPDLCQFCGNEVVLLEGFHTCALFYDGQRANANLRRYSDDYMFFDYQHFYRVDNPNDIYHEANFHYMNSDSDYTGYDSCDAYIHHTSYEGDTHEYSHAYYRTGHWEYEEYDGERFHVLKTGTIYSYNKTNELSDNYSEPYYTTEMHIAEGDFAFEIGSSEKSIFSYHVNNYLYNGTITICQTNSSYPDSDYIVQFDVVNGIVQRTDDMGVEYSEADGIYHLYVKMMVASAGGGYYPEYVHTSDAETEEELFHASNWNNLNYDYYTVQ